MADFITQLTCSDNLYWAWNKVKKQYQKEALWVDQIALAGFEANLQNNLKSIAEDLQDNSYINKPIVPVLFPKKDNKVRQLFEISVRDQVAWMALINVIGPVIDCKMQSWSYGSRLYRPVWYEYVEKNINDEDKVIKKQHVDWYRHSSGHIYRKFKHSWPLFRKDIYLTFKHMSGNTSKDKGEKQREKDNDDAKPYLKLKFLTNGYWENTSEKIYWAGIDFKKFYPSIQLDNVLDNIIQAINRSSFMDETSKIKSVLSCLMAYRITKIDLENYNNHIDDEKIILKLDSDDRYIFPNIPTGHFAAPFLANVAMMKIDNIVSKRLKNNNSIAHFRYVDDHVILSQSFDELHAWIKAYEKIVSEHGNGIKINAEKTEPKILSQYLNKPDNEELKKDAIKDCELDPHIPSPIMTETIAQISNIAQIDFAMLDNSEKASLFLQLEHLLLAKFEDSEIREDTRMSFAANKIAWLAPELPNRGMLIEVLEKEFGNCKSELKKITSKTKTIKHKINKYQEKIISKNIKSRSNARNKITEFEKQEKELLKKREDITYRKSNIKLLADKAKSKQEDLKGIFDQEKIKSLLLKTVSKYPDKLRLWRTLLFYCMNIGKDLSGIEKEIGHFCEAGKSKTCSYLCQYLKQVFAEQIILCTNNITNHEELYEKRIASYKYLTGLLVLYKDKFASCQCHIKNNHSIANSIMSCVIGASKVLLSKYTSNDEFLNKCQEILSVIENNKYVINPIDWKKPDVKILEKHKLDYYAWWTENSFINISTTEKGPVASQINLNKTPLLKMRFIKDKQFKSINGLNLSEFLYIINDKTKEKEELLLNSEIAKLRLFSMVLAKISISHLNKKIILRPENIVIKCKKTKEDIEALINETVNIDKYEYFFDNIIILIKSNIVNKWKVSEIWGSGFGKKSIDKDYENIKTTALILLGLLKGSYSFPCIWNHEGLQKAYSNLSWQIIKELNCSTKTFYILCSCLLPRYREIYLIEKGLITQPESTDRSEIFPEINCYDDLSRHVESAITALENYRIISYDNKYRQLIPIKLNTIKDACWFTEKDSN